MNKRKRRMRAIIASSVFVSILIITTVLTTLINRAYESSHSRRVSSLSSGNLTLEFVSKPKARAPEPSTLALFGSGLLGMIVSLFRKTYGMAKDLFDRIISVLAAVLLAPVFFVIALLITWTSPGPALFTQIRVGKNGKPFKMYKFRTMQVDAEKMSGPVWAKENDPRLIPIGKFLRKTHLDEIPQFLNVLRGEMSFIGPRPERPVFVYKLKQEINGYEKRLEIKPGITGLAQVYHRYDETIADVRKKIKYDVLYIKKLCLWTDLLICLRTVKVLLTGGGGAR